MGTHKKHLSEALLVILFELEFYSKSTLLYKAGTINSIKVPYLDL